jgi:hypothetical protein
MKLDMAIESEHALALQGVPERWKGSALHSECTLHQISPYIGKTKSSMARGLIENFTTRGQTVSDPFCGCGTIALEAWLAGRNCIATDLSPYAHLLTVAKLFPPDTLEHAMQQVQSAAKDVAEAESRTDLRSVPKWVREFFHPDTLKETIAWCSVLKARRYNFLLAALLGILHHQRPGFLSYPSSHAVPYLRHRLFPRTNFPHLYEYRSVRDRLERKIARAYRRIPYLERQLTRICYRRDARLFVPPRDVDAIITSPPYMWQLDYGRDNRLRLWFLGVDWSQGLDARVSPGELDFLNLIRDCFVQWRRVLKSDGVCVLIVGDNYIRSYRAYLPDALIRVATCEVGRFELTHRHTEPIPGDRRVRRAYRGNSSETVLVFRKTSC